MPEPLDWFDRWAPYKNMRLAWATDVHLNFLGVWEREWFYRSVRESADALLVTGDIAESPYLHRGLLEIQWMVERPVYFVLGNHDFYQGSIAGTRAATAEMVRSSADLVYLSQSRVLEMAPATALVGHDGWADARLGDFEHSDVILNDYLMIEELRHWTEGGELDKPALARAMRAQADEAAEHLASVLPEAAKRFARVVVATHVPPFRQAAWHLGKPSDDNNLPHFACKATGDVLLRVAEAYPQCHLLVLCGHTHSAGEFRPRENLLVRTGKAEYGRPAIQEVLELG